MHPYFRDLQRLTDKVLAYVADEETRLEVKRLARQAQAPHTRTFALYRMRAIFRRYSNAILEA